LAEAHHVPLGALAATGPEGAIVERDVQSYLAQSSAPPLMTPVARRMAEAANLDWQNFSSKGQHSRITRADVAGVLSAGPETTEPASTTCPGEEAFELIPLDGTRTIIAQRMMESVATTAQVTLTAEADATRLVELRQQLHQNGIAVSYNDLFIFILGRALRDFPRLNASLDTAQNGVRIWRPIHMGLAVDTERGLLVPVIRDVAGKGLGQLAVETKALIERAQAGHCTPDELRGSTFTLTNLGMYGIDTFTPLLNLPECAILGVGRIKTQPVMLNEVVVGRRMVWLSLTFDHRLVDGGPAARFLQRIVQLVEHPALLLA
jgi:pyruvate dehydrogenase E2 component (dihydrolipoamide acetyltransferase)